MKEHYRLTKLGDCKPGDRRHEYPTAVDGVLAEVQELPGYRCAHRARHQLRRHKEELEQ